MMVRTIIKSLTCYFFSLLAINNTFADGEWQDYQQFEANPQDTTKSNSEMQDWVQQETDWWDHQQQILSEKIPQETPKKNKSQFKLTAKYWEKIKPYFFKNNIYVGYCVLDAYNDSLPLIITKVRNKTAYSISVDVNVYAKDINDTRDLKLCHTEDLLNAYAWDDSQNVRYDSPECIYEMYFKLCPLSDYPKSEIPGILVPLSLETTKQKISDDKLKKSKDLNKMLKDGMETIWEKEQEEAWDKKTKDLETENSQILNSPEVIAWQEWFKGSLNALKAVTFDFKKNVIDPVCTEETFNTLFQKYFGKINQNETISQQAQQEKEQFYQEIENLRVQLTQSENLEKELRAEIEKLKTDLSKTPAEPATTDAIKTEEPVHETKTEEKIEELKHVNEDNVLDSTKQYQDDSKNEKSSLTEENIQQTQDYQETKNLHVQLTQSENLEKELKTETEKLKTDLAKTPAETATTDAIKTEELVHETKTKEKIEELKHVNENNVLDSTKQYKDDSKNEKSSLAEENIRQTQDYQEIKNLRVQLTQSENLEKELKTETEKLKTDLSKTPAEPATTDVIKTEEPVHETKTKEKIEELKHVNENNVLDSTKQYQDDSKNEKSSLTEENIRQTQDYQETKNLHFQPKQSENLEKELKTETEKLKTDLAKTPAEPATTDVIKTEEPVHETKTEEKIEELKHVNENNVLDSTKQYQDDSKNEKSSLAEENIRQTQDYQEIENLRVQLTQSENLEKELKAETEKLKTDLSKTPAEPATTDAIKTEEPVHETKDGRKIGKLKRVNGSNLSNSIKQYKDDSKNEKSNLTEESIKQMKEISRQKMLKKAKENIEGSKNAELEKAKGIQQFGSTISNITKELNQISNRNEDFDPKESLKRIKNKDYIKEEPKEIKPNIEPKKLNLDTNFKQNMESIWGGKQPSKPIENTREGTHKPTPMKIDPSFAEKLQNDLGAKRMNQPVQKPVTQETESAPVLNLQQKSTTQTPIPTPHPLNLNSDKTQPQQGFYIPQAPESTFPFFYNKPNNKHELGKRQKTFNRS